MFMTEEMEEAARVLETTPVYRNKTNKTQRWSVRGLLNGLFGIQVNNKGTLVSEKEIFAFMRARGFLDEIADGLNKIFSNSDALQQALTKTKERLNDGASMALTEGDNIKKEGKAAIRKERTLVPLIDKELTRVKEEEEVQLRFAMAMIKCIELGLRPDEAEKLLVGFKEEIYELCNTLKPPREHSQLTLFERVDASIKEGREQTMLSKNVPIEEGFDEHNAFDRRSRGAHYGLYFEELSQYISILLKEDKGFSSVRDAILRLFYNELDKRGLKEKLGIDRAQ